MALTTRPKLIAIAFLLIHSLLFHHSNLTSIAAPSSSSSSSSLSSSAAVAVPLHTVHIVSHSHQDVGWLLTPEQYYTESVREITTSVISHIVSSDEKSLATQRRFITGSEVYFLWKWWTDKSVDVVHKDRLRQLVQSGRMELVNGGWTMPDEIITTQESLIHTLTRGHRKLKEMFGDGVTMPKVSWRIDPFGSNPLVSQLYRMSGMKDGTVVFRIAEQIRERKRMEKNMEFLWKMGQSFDSDLGSDMRGELFTHVMDYQYCVWNLVTGWDTPTTEHNLQQRRFDLLEEIDKRYKGYKSGHLLLPFGCDFSFKRPEVHYSVLEPLIESINSDTNYTIRYSTLTKYFDVVKNDVSGKEDPWQSYEGDFTPYSDGPDAWWSGYYDSYPAVKKLSRRAEGMLHALNMLFSFASVHIRSLQSHQQKQTEVDVFAEWFHNKGSVALDQLQDIVAVMTHHDAITGTSKKAVMQYYSDKLKEAMSKGRLLMVKCIEALAWERLHPTDNMILDIIDEERPARLTAQAKGNRQTVVLFNPLAWDRSPTILQLHVQNTFSNSLCFDVSDGSNRSFRNIPYQVVPLPNREDGAAANIIYVDVPASIPALGFITMEVYQCDKPQRIKSNVQDLSSIVQQFTISNSLVELTFCAGTGRLCLYKDVVSGEETDLSQDLHVYTVNAGKGHPSGAYVFNPEEPTAPLLPGDGAASITIVHGDLVSEVRQTFPNNVKQVIRLRRGTRAIDLEYSVGQIPVDREIVTRFNMSSISNTAISVDYNGLKMKRQRVEDSRPLGGWFFPSVTNVAISNDDDDLDGSRLLIHTQQPHAVASLASGQLEIKLQRRTSVDDHKGLNEPLDDISPVHIRMELHVKLGDVQPDACLEEQQRFLEAKYFNNPLVQFISRLDVDQPKQVSGSHLKKQFPSNIHLLSLDPILSNDPDDEGTILRLQNLGNCAQQKPEVDLSEYVASKLQLINETNLTTGEVLTNMDTNARPVVQVNEHVIQTFIVRLTPDSLPTSDGEISVIPGYVLVWTVFVVVTFAALIGTCALCCSSAPWIYRRVKDMSNNNLSTSGYSFI